MFNRLLRRTNDTTTAPMDVDPQTTLNVLVHGDPSSGKSALIEKFLDPSKTIRATADDQNDYWNFSSVCSQDNTSNTLNKKEKKKLKQTQGPSFFDYNGIKVRFEEVPGSRGRMSNYHSLVRANDVADAIIYCVSAGHNSYNYYGTLAENINGGLSTMDRINGMYDVKGKKSASAPTTEKKEKTKSAKLSFAVVTMIDQPERSVVDRSAINVEDVLVYETSAVTGEGVQSTLLGIQKKKKKKKLFLSF